MQIYTLSSTICWRDCSFLACCHAKDTGLLNQISIHRKTNQHDTLGNESHIIQLYKLLPKKFLQSLILSGSKNQDAPENSTFKRVILKFMPPNIQILIFDFYSLSLLSTCNLSEILSMLLLKPILESFYLSHLDKCNSCLVFLHLLVSLLLYK